MSEQPTKMWSGRFREPLDAVFEQWQRSFPFDVRLLPQEVAASKAHARMIAAAGILTDAELERMIDGLDQVGDIVPEFAPIEPGMVNPRLLGAELGTTPRSIRRWLSRQPEFNESHVKHTRIVLAKDDPLLLRMKNHFAIQANLNLDGDAAYEEFSATTEADLAASMAHAEDIHHFVELQLTRVIGPLALKLHTGRSRNEQIATDMRLYVREAIDNIVKGLRRWALALVELAEQADDAAMPSYTHMQRAEPVLVAHWLLAYVAMIERDISRLADARRRMNLCPLGSGAVAGATLALDRDYRGAKPWASSAPTPNSMDATSDRDFLLEFTQALATLGVHISRFAEELTLYSTAEFGFLDLPEAFSTGSSAMPQKKNPDFTELVRGKSARLAGAATTLAVLLKGLPLAYNKDLQEGQEPVFDAADTVRGILGDSACIHALAEVQLRADEDGGGDWLSERDGCGDLSLEQGRAVPQGARDRRQRGAAGAGERARAGCALAGGAAGVESGLRRRLSCGDCAGGHAGLPRCNRRDGARAGPCGADGGPPAAEFGRIGATLRR